MTTNGKGSLTARHALAFEATAIPHLLSQADVILAVGTRFAPRSGTRWPLSDHQTLIKVDAEAGELTRGIAPQVSIEGDARAVTDLIVNGVLARHPQLRVEHKRGSVALHCVTSYCCGVSFAFSSGFSGFLTDTFFS